MSSYTCSLIAEFALLPPPYVSFLFSFLGFNLLNALCRQAQLLSFCSRSAFLHIPQICGIRFFLRVAGNPLYTMFSTLALILVTLRLVQRHPPLSLHLFRKLSLPRSTHLPHSLCKQVPYSSLTLQQRFLQPILGNQLPKLLQPPRFANPATSFPMKE